MSAALPPDENRAVSLLLCFWVPFPFTVGLVVTRFYCRGMRKDLGYDDWTILVAWMLYTAAAAMSTAMELRGGARHVAYLSAEEILYIGKMQIINQFPAALSAMCGKISVALFIMRISGRTSKWRRWFLTVHIVLYFCLTVLSLCMLIGQCKPVQALWDMSLRTSGQASCLDARINTDITMLHKAFGAYLDFVLALLPLSFIIDLKVSLRKRIVLFCILSLGIVAGICACIKTSEFIPATAGTDPTWDGYALYLWAFLEIPLVIIAACIPPSKPIWDFLVKGQPIRPSTNHSSSNYTASGGSTGSYRIGFVKTSVRAQKQKHAQKKTGQADDGVNLIFHGGKGGMGTATKGNKIQQTVLITQTSRERGSPRQSETSVGSPV
ncbi:uncharacterized protein BO95DRAFT_488807 [Aspergillus brunneoviolaceus CBS 621.78]|uniref:Uncharacterized protein n=1 Tax=Aspergillus brunneoviolaceus CBS 621.78 TaxID=1450534 RepID=A0ACD1FSI0_9EURO|nr:hypothetical protein BO95DRAFT_488807 [Aspergillus brunneoviolaceus CBS 621.78]RAH39937.1 hypothetical protein BO95DRAFT_488807 [Aspergillus brunneoviolaceus CBS 621.78]